MATHHDFTDLTGALVIAENRLLYVAVPDEQPLAEVRRTPRDIRTLPIMCMQGRTDPSLPPHRKHPWPVSRGEASP